MGFSSLARCDMVKVNGRQPCTLAYIIFIASISAIPRFSTASKCPRVEIEDTQTIFSKQENLWHRTVYIVAVDCCFSDSFLSKIQVYHV